MDPFTPEAARVVGTALVRLHFTQPEALGRSNEVLGVHLLADLPPVQQNALLPRLGAVIGAMAVGFTSAMRASIPPTIETMLRIAHCDANCQNWGWG